MRRRCALVGALFLLGLATPASADAAVIFGSDLTLAPLQPPAPECTGPGTGPCTDVAFSFHTGNTLPTTAPVSGVITSVRYRSSTADTATLRLARLNGQQQATGAGTGPTATLEATGQITEVPVNPGLPVQPGDYLAGDGTTGTTFNCTQGTGATASFHLYLPPLVNGDPFRTRTTENSCEILVQATIEADADGDRLGDESQDADDDNDGVPDTTDNCPLTPNPSQSNVDGDALGDACDLIDDRPPPPDVPDSGARPPARRTCGERHRHDRLPRRIHTHRQGERRQKGLTFIPLEQAREIPVGSFLNTRRGTVRPHLGHERRGQDPVGQLLARPVPGAAVAQAQRQGPYRAAAEGLELQRLPPRPLGLGRRRAQPARDPAPARKRTRSLPHARPQQLGDGARHRVGGYGPLRRDADEGHARQGRGTRLPPKKTVSCAPARATWPGRRAEREARASCLLEGPRRPAEVRRTECSATSRGTRSSVARCARRSYHPNPRSLL